MTLTFKHGDLFAEPVEALVNTVNCVGVMGKGVALEFKRRWPDNFKAYKKACDADALVPGKMMVFDTHQLFSGVGPRYLINFPTKAHWRSPSQLSYIKDGLDTLVRDIRDLRIRSIALPPLGCGNGGLDWDDVRPLIESKLAELSDVDITVMLPKESPDLPEFRNASSVKMSYPRAMLLKALNDLEIYFNGQFDRISMQKIVYFLQALGVDFGLRFERNQFGPYSEPLKKAFEAFEKHGLIAGFSGKDQLSHVTRHGCAVADEFLKDFDQSADGTIKRLNFLVQGYESPYGMELLSSVHWLAHHENQYPVEKIIEAMKGWSDRKSDVFDEESIRGAYGRLKDDGLIH